MRKCPFNNCGKDIPDTMFACGPHWSTLNYNQKRRITDAYTDYLQDRIGVERLRELQRAVLDEVQPRNLFNQK